MDFFSDNLKFLRKRRNSTQQTVASSTGLSRNNINTLENKITQPSVMQLQRISQYFGITIDSLINVNLSALSESDFTDLQNGFDVYLKGSNIRVIPIIVDSENENMVELVSEKAKAGYSTGFADPEYIEQLPVLTLPYLSKGTKYRAFTISGDSMLPFMEGDIIIAEYLEDFYTIKTGELYVVVTKEDGIVFKILENYIEADNSIKLVSMNPIYKPYVYNVSDIMEVWKFKSYISNKIPETFTDIEQIHNNILEIKKGVDRLGGAFGDKKLTS